MKNNLKKLYLKVIAVAVTMVMIITMSVSVSYAWVILSKNPAVSGAQITIAGGNTILLAPDMTEVVNVDGEDITVHYPGAFSDKIDLSDCATYDYLSDVCGLTPVSTADGLYWILANYDETTGIIKDISKFGVDSTLQHANMSEPDHTGSYIYIDFWVVSPGSEYKLRVSSDVKSREGSSVIEIPKVKEDENSFTGYALDDSSGEAASSVRVGFLASSSNAPDNDVLAYSRSRAFETRYGKLIGSYQEPGNTPDPLDISKFTIYEPNGTLHTVQSLENGDYAATYPLGYDPYMQVISEVDIRDRLTVQSCSEWKLLGEQRQIDQVFQAGISGMHDVKEDRLLDKFFNEYLQWNVAPYITAGKFFTNTSTLYANLISGKADKDAIAENVETSGATDDVYITELQRNTPQRIRMFIWIEGQDIDCASTNISVTDFLLNLELAGASK